jgi:hypothetical protein
MSRKITSEKCIICNSANANVISESIREGVHNVLKCNTCGFVFLQDYKSIDYSSGYDGLTLSKEWDKEDALIKRSQSLERFNRIVADLILSKDDCNILEIGAGNGASIYGLNKLIGASTIDCVELNNNDKQYLEEEFDVNVYSNILDVKKKYQVVYGHHVFEHFISPIRVLNEINEITTEDCRLYLSFPNFNDFYSHTLGSEQKNKYLTFNFHLAHPYYYTVETFSSLVENTPWKISQILTIQDYSIVNYFNWYINGIRSRNIESGTRVNKNIERLNITFINMIEKMHKGNNISVILGKK